MSFYASTLLLLLGTLLYTAVFTNGQVILAPAGRHVCPQSGLNRLQNQPRYPMNVIVAMEQLTPDNSNNAAPADSSPQPSRCRSDASRVFTKLFSIPGAVADSLLSGEIMF
ncbi:hypothetical protein RR48_08583 [Papilio machaon]|uniref:Uncharacterized protein n=1 Tax=Papilio machaon TaxID=76193 RepID=A0A194RIL0_PAPMA|nr:hypothetical protein RR48_08583 [Papilio machaon]